MKCSVVMSLIFLLAAVGTNTMEKKPSNDRLVARKTSQPFIPLSPKRRDSMDELRPDKPLTPEQKTAILNARQRTSKEKIAILYSLQDIK